jgi:hypothetical protein
VIPLPGIRQKGGAPVLGARSPGQSGPYGPRPGEQHDHDQGDAEQQPDGGQDDEQHAH